MLRSRAQLFGFWEVNVRSAMIGGAYINDCFAKNGNVPAPTAPAKKN
jgi:hypothetical protein